jgi:hypothetical protein
MHEVLQLRHQLTGDGKSQLDEMLIKQAEPKSPHLRFDSQQCSYFAYANSKAKMGSTQKATWKGRCEGAHRRRNSS